MCKQNDPRSIKKSDQILLILISVHHLTGIFFQFWGGAIGPFRLRKISVVKP